MARGKYYNTETKEQYDRKYNQAIANSIETHKQENRKKSEKIEYDIKYKQVLDESIKTFKQEQENRKELNNDAVSLSPNNHENNQAINNYQLELTNNNNNNAPRISNIINVHIGGNINVINVDASHMANHNPVLAALGRLNINGNVANGKGNIFDGDDDSLI